MTWSKTTSGTGWPGCCCVPTRRRSATVPAGAAGLWNVNTRPSVGGGGGVRGGERVVGDQVAARVAPLDVDEGLGRPGQRACSTGTITYTEPVHCSPGLARRSAASSARSPSVPLFSPETLAATEPWIASEDVPMDAVLVPAGEDGSRGAGDLEAGVHRRALRGGRTGRRRARRRRRGGRAADFSGWAFRAPRQASRGSAGGRGTRGRAPRRTAPARGLYRLSTRLRAWRPAAVCSTQRYTPLGARLPSLVRPSQLAECCPGSASPWNSVATRRPVTSKTARSAAAALRQGEADARGALERVRRGAPAAWARRTAARRRRPPRPSGATPRCRRRRRRRSLFVAVLEKPNCMNWPTRPASTVIEMV